MFLQVSALRGILLRRGGLEAPSEGAAACLQTPATETLPGRRDEVMDSVMDSQVDCGSNWAGLDWAGFGVWKDVEYDHTSCICFFWGEDITR